MTTTMHVEARNDASAPIPWPRALAAAAAIVLSFAIPIPASEAAEAPAALLAGPHAQLELLMSARGSSVQATREGLVALRDSLRPVTARLRGAHPVLATALEQEVDDALAQADAGGGALLLSDRAEFEVYYLVPIGQTLLDADDALGGRAR